MGYIIVNFYLCLAFVAIIVTRFFFQSYWNVWCLFINVVAIYKYWEDKQLSQQRSKQQRIPEGELHLYGILGGWIGAFIAQQLFRHKTRKISFQMLFFLSIFIHYILLYGVYIKHCTQTECPILSEYVYNI